MKNVALAQMNGRHQEISHELLWPRNQQISITCISLEILGPGKHERPASRASVANCFGPAINRSSSRDQLGNTWAWHTRTASITSISCELLWPRNQQVIITRSAWKHLGLAHTNDQHHEHQLRIAVARSQQVSITSISIEECGSAADERPASRDQLRIAVAPQSTDQHHVR